MNIAAMLKGKLSAVIAGGIYIATCVLLYFIQYRLYGGAVETRLLGFVLAPLLGVAFWLARDEDKLGTTRGNARWAKLGVALQILLVLIAIGANLYLIGANPYQIISYFYLSMLVAVIAIEVYRHTKGIKRVKASQILALAYAAVICCALLYLAIAAPCTVSGAQKQLMAAGYEEIEYKGNYAAQLPAVMMETGQIPSEPLGVYLLRAYKDGQIQGVFVGVVSGEIVASDVAHEGSVLRSFL